MGELSQHRLALGKLLAQIALPDADETALKTPAQARASRAAQTRMRTHNRQADG